MERAVISRMNIGERAHIGDPTAAGVGQHIKGTQQRLAVGGHGHDAATLPSATSIFRTIKSFSEMQVEFVGTRLQWNVVTEITLTAGAVDGWILGAPDVRGCAVHGAPAGEVCI